MTRSYEGRAVGCRAAVGVDEEALEVTITLDWGMVDHIKRLGPNVIVRTGSTTIWIELDEADEAYAAIESFAPEEARRPESRQAEPKPEKKRRSRRLFRG